MEDLPKLAARAPDAHKGNFGHALLIGGSRRMAGSISIAGMATLQSGAGLVRLAVPEGSLQVVASFNPCYMTIPLAQTDSGQLAAAALDELETWIEQATCVGLGPGLGQTDDMPHMIGRLYRETERPMVVDADGLTALSRTDWSGRFDAARILTPHPIEFQRLSGVAAHDRNAQITAAQQIAREKRLVIILKGNRSIVTDGQNTYTNTTGNPGMASGGSGDCLTGILVALLCQGMSAYDAAVLGTFLHGRAGDLAMAGKGGICVLATDIIQYIPKAFDSLKNGSDAGI